MTDIEVRAASEHDIEAVTAIYADAVLNGTASYELDPPDRNEMASRYRAVASAGLPWLVAEQGGTIVGYAYAGPFRPRPAYRFCVEDSVYVAPVAHGRGVGAALLSRLIAEVTSQGYRQMIGVIGDGRPESASVRLHRKLGFTDAGVLNATGYKHGRWLDTAFMQLTLHADPLSPPDQDAVPERRFRGLLG
jgi:L-amino acid N-acyltransferase YncA